MTAVSPVEKTLRVAIVYNPFKAHEIEFVNLPYEEGATLADYIGNIGDGEWSVGFRGEAYDKERWTEVTPGEGEGFSLVAIPESGGSGGGKDILRSVAMIAIMVAAFYVVGPWAASFFGVSGATATAVSAVAAGTFTAAGMMLVNAILPPPELNTSKGDGASYGIDGPKNTSREGVVVPIVFGKYRVGGNIVDLYTKNVGDDQYLFMRVVLNDGRIKSAGEFEINDQPIENFTDVETRVALGTEEGEPNDWFDEAVRQFNRAVKLDTSWTMHTTTGEVDRIRLDYLYPQGLHYRKADGRILNAESDLEIQYRLSGTSTWLPLLSGVERRFVSYSGGTAPLPGVGGISPVEQGGSRFYAGMETRNQQNEVVPVDGATFEGATPTGFTGTNPSTGSSTDALKFAVPTGSSRVKLTALAAVASEDGASVGAFDMTIAYREVGAANWIVVKREQGTVERVRSDSDWSSFPLVYRTHAFSLDPAKSYEVTAFGGTITTGSAFGATGDGIVRLLRAKEELFRYSYESAVLPRGQYDVRTRRMLPIEDNKSRVDEVYLQDVAEIDVDNIHYVGTANVSLKIKLGEQISGIPKLTSMVEGSVVKIFDEDGNVTEEAWSPWPADQVLDILLNQERGRGISQSRIDFAAYKEWRDHCIANNLQFNGVFDQKTNVWDATQVVSRVGHAQMLRVGTRYSVVIDKKSDPVQLFNDSNIIEGTFSTVWLPLSERANEIQYTFYPEEDGFQEKMLRVVDPYYANDGNGTKVAQIREIGVTSYEQAKYNIEKQLRENRLLKKTVSFDAPLESIGLSIGDVAAVQHSSANYGKGVGTGRLKAGSSLSSLNLDCAIDLDTDKEYRALLVQSALKRYEATVENVQGNTIYVSGLPAELDRCRRLIQGSRDTAIKDVIEGTPHDRIVVENATGFVAGVVELWDTDVIEERDIARDTRTNHVRNTVGLGVPDSVNTSPQDVLPTNWFTGPTYGLTRTTVGKGKLPDGRDYVDFRFQGTATSGTMHIYPDTYAIPVTPGEEHSFGFETALIAGSASQITAKPYMIFDYRTAANTDFSGGIGNGFASMTEFDGTLRPYRATRVAPAQAGLMRPRIRIECVTGQPIDFTWRIAGVIAEDGPEIGEYIPSEGTPGTAYVRVTGAETVDLASPLPVAPDQHAVWMVGPVESVKRLFRLRSIAGDGLHRRTLHFVQYEDEIYEPLGAPIARPDPSPSPVSAHVHGLSLNYPPVLDGGQTRVKVSVGWTPSDERYAGADIYMALNGADFAFVRTVQNATAFETDLKLGDDVQFRVVGFNSNSRRAPINTAPAIGTVIMAAPETLDAVESVSASTNYFRVDAAVTVSWTAAISPFNRDFRVQYATITQVQFEDEGFDPSSISESSWNDVGSTKALSLEVPRQDVGYYAYRVRAEYGRALSEWTYHTFELTSPAIVAAPTGLRLDGGGAVFTGQDAKFVWDDIGEFADPTATFTFRDFLVRVLTPEDVLIREETTADNRYVYTAEKNIEDHAADPNRRARRTFKVEVRVRGLQGQVSNPATLSVSNPAPSVPTLVSTKAGVDGFALTLAEAVDSDHAGVVLYVSTTDGFTPGPANLVFEGLGQPRFTGVPQTTYYFRYGAYDTFGRDGMVLSAQQSVTTPGIDSGTVVPVVPDDIAGTPSLNIAAPTLTTDGSLRSVASADWNDATNAVEYLVEIEENGVARQQVFPTSAFVDFPTVPGQSYRYRAKGKSRTGHLSVAWSDWSATVSAPGDTTAPGAPTSPLVFARGLRNYITWVPATAADYRGLILWRTTTSSAPTLATTPYSPIVEAAFFVDDAVTPGQQYWYWGASVDRSGNVGAITALGNVTARFVNVGSGDISPTDTNLVTILGISNGIVNQGTGATANTLAQLNPGEGSAFTDVTTGDGVALPMYVSGADTATFVGSRYTRTSGTSTFNQMALSRQAISGPAQASGRLLTGFTAIGFTSAAAIVGNNAQTTMGPHWYRTSTTYLCYSGGTLLLNCGTALNGVTFGPNTVFAVTDDGITQSWWADGVLMHSRPTPAGSTLRRLGAYAYSNGNSVGSLKLEPFNNAQWSVVSGIGRPDDNASRADNTVINWDFGRGFENWRLSNPGIYTLDGRWALYTGTSGNAAIYPNTPEGASLVAPNDMWVRSIEGQRLFVSLDRRTTAARRVAVLVDFYSAAGVAHGTTYYVTDVTTNTSDTVVRDRGSVVVPSGFPIARVAVLTWGTATGVTRFSKLRVGLTQEAADRTSENVASGFVGQGGLSLLNNLSWSGGLLIDRPLELTDGRIAAGLDASGNVSRPLTVPLADQSNLLRRTNGGLYSGDLNATLGARAGTNLFRTDGTTVMTQAEVRTAEGVSSGFTGQGGLSLLNNISWGGGLLVDRPANIAALNGSEAIQNSGITLAANGQLLGAGGGAVTPAGLGVPTSVEVADAFDGFQQDLESGAVIPATFQGRGALASADHIVSGVNIRDSNGVLVPESRLINDMGHAAGVIEGGTKRFSNGQFAPMGGQAFLIEAADGEVVTYATPYPVPPTIVPLNENLDGLSAGEYYVLSPVNQSGSGFTARARRVSPGSAPVYTTRLDDGITTPADVTIDLDEQGAERNKSLSGVAYNEQYVAVVRVSLRGVVVDYDNDPELPQPLPIYGSVPVTISLYGKQTVGGPWVYMGATTVNSPASNTAQESDVTITGSIDWATWEVFAGKEYRVAITQNGQPSARYIVAFKSVTYQEQTGGSGATNVTALSGGRKVRYQINPKDG